MTAPEHNPAAWAVAVALAAESGLDWGRWASGITERPYCGACFGVGHPALYTDSDANRLRGCLRPYDCAARLVRPVPAPWDADAYRADCARRSVEPGPMPSLSWTGPDGFGWAAHYDETFKTVRIAFADGEEIIAWWYGHVDTIEWCEHRSHPRELVARIVTLAIAAKRAMVKP